MILRVDQTKITKQTRTELGGVIVADASVWYIKKIVQKIKRRKMCSIQ